MSTSLKRTGLLWGLTLTLLANLVQAGNIKQGGNDGSVTVAYMQPAVDFQTCE